MSAVDLERRVWQLADRSRWFSARGSQLDSFELGPEPHPGLRAAFLNTLGRDGRQRFFVPLSYRSAEPRDACDDGGLLLDALRADAPGFTRMVDLPADLPARRYGGEQSNTTVFFGEQVLAKVYRRLEPGRNVEVELHEALAGSGVAAELLGTWSHDGTDLAIFLEVLPDARDGYVLAVQHAERGAGFEHHAQALGVALARLHQALADRLGTATASGAAFVAQWRAGWDQALAEIPRLAACSPAVGDAFAAAAAEEFTVQRVHGDCHLGQALLSGGGWRFVDFEGEPLKSYAQRRRPDSPLRDVAGLLRSFDYAAAAGGAPAGWLSQCRAAFLDGYGLSASTLLRAYEIDKAAYEARYEARHRPQLLHVPLTHLGGTDPRR